MANAVLSEACAGQLKGASLISFNYSDPVLARS